MCSDEFHESVPTIPVNPVKRRWTSSSVWFDVITDPAVRGVSPASGFRIQTSSIRFGRKQR